MSELKRGEAKIEWRFRVTSGPGSAVVETSWWGHHAVMSDTESITDDSRRWMAELVALQFAETLCRELGVEATVKVDIRHDS